MLGASVGCRWSKVVFTLCWLWNTRSHAEANVQNECLAKAVCLPWALLRFKETEVWWERNLSVFSCGHLWGEGCECLWLFVCVSERERACAIKPRVLESAVIEAVLKSLKSTNVLSEYYQHVLWLSPIIVYNISNTDTAICKLHFYAVATQAKRCNISR